jgi:hypothetical protein
LSPENSEKKKSDQEKGWNSISNLTNYASLSGVLAGFSVTFIALILAQHASDTNFIVPLLKFGQITVLLFGVSTGFFIGAAESFLRAKAFDIYSLTEEYKLSIKIDLECEDENEWVKRKESQRASLLFHASRGLWFYNAAIYTVFVGLWFAIAPYNIFIASIVSGLGIAVELLQSFATKSKSIQHDNQG